ncbi:MAG TPA: BatA and WFA domain-containing protein [Bryobacteraceae bacterium]|nr:BatA and WFA domain-containing protein [Bryobacteraceae bacterium]
MHLLNLTLGQFLAVFGSVSALTLALYLLDRSRRRQMVSTLRFWVSAEQPAQAARRRRIQQPFSLILQLVSMALLVLAIAQLRLGAPAAAPRDHVLILDTSAWMAARVGGHTLMDRARERARAYIHAVPLRDRIMLVRADALTTPATAFEPDRRKLEDAIAASQPGSTALNLDQALAFARQIQAQSGRRAGEVVFVGTGKLSARDPGKLGLPNLRFLNVADAIENCGLRRVGVRRAAADSDAWEIYVSLRNYGTAPHPVTLALSFGPSADGPGSLPVGSQHLTLAPGADREATFQFQGRTAGILRVQILPHDAFPADDRVTLPLPGDAVLHVNVYSAAPDWLRPVLAASPQVAATFHSPADYRADSNGALVMLEHFHPPAPPQGDAIWIDPPEGGSPIPVRARVTDAPLTHWLTDHPLGAGLRAKDFRLASATVFEAAPDDLKISDVAEGPVMVARPGKPKIVVLGFNPALSAMRYELATPLLFANLLRWMAPGIFRRWELTAGSVGTVKTPLDPDVRAADVRVLRADGSPAPYTLRGASLEFFSGTPGTVRVLAGDREYVYSLTLPQLWESKWDVPPETRRGIPRFAAPVGGATDLWQWLALLGGAGLLAEWILFGRFRRAMARAIRRPVAMRKAS